MTLEIRLLGRFSARRGGHEIAGTAYGGRRVRRLIRILVSRRGQFVTKDALVEALWPERPPADPMRNLEILIVRARRALGDAKLIQTGPGGYTFAKDQRCEVDVERFTDRVQTGLRHLARGQFAAALPAFREAMRLWAGEPLAEDAYEEWAQQARNELSRLYLEAVEGGSQAALGVGDFAAAVRSAERAVDWDPLREPANMLFVRALAAAGDTRGALGAFDRYRDRLREELGEATPSVEALEITSRILRGEPLPPLIARPVPPAAPAPFKPSLAFVGRDAEVERLAAAASGTGARVILISGGAGTGKSRLLAEAAIRSPVPVLSARAFSPEHDDAWAVARSLLREALSLDLDAARAVSPPAAYALTTVIPEIRELRDVSEVPADLESRRALAIEASLRIIETAAPDGVLLLVDDAQWADATSLALLLLAASRLTGVALGLTFRPGDMPPSTPLAASLAAFRRIGAEEISLGRLPREAVERLVGDSDLAGVLSEETDGTPFTIQEVLHRLAREGAVERFADGRWRRIRPDVSVVARPAARAGQQRVLAQRIQQLPQKVRPTLYLLAVIAREIPARVLAGGLGRPEAEVLLDLDALAVAGFVRLGESGWAVAHDLIGEAIATDVPREELARFHAQAAAVLAAEGGESAEVARHLQSSGDPQAAARAYAQAARLALDRFANEEVRRLANLGLALLSEDSDLREMRGEASARLGDFFSARADFAGLLFRAGTQQTRSRLLTRLAMLEAGATATDYAAALALAERAIQVAGSSPIDRAHALAAAARIDFNLGNHARCRERSAEALAIFEAVGDLQGIARVVDTDALATHEEGRITEAVQKFDRAASTFADLGELFRSVMPRATRGLALTYMGRTDEALRDIDDALGVARMLGYREGEGYALYQRANTLAWMGRGAEAIEAAHAGHAIAASIHHHEWQCATRRVLGDAYLASGALNEAEREFREALEAAWGMPIHETWAASGLVLTLIRRGRAEEARPYAERALASGARAKGARYRALLARAELAAALKEPGAKELAARALAEAEAGGHLASVPRLRVLAGMPEQTRAGPETMRRPASPVK